MTRAYIYLEVYQMEIRKSKFRVVNHAKQFYYGIQKYSVSYNKFRKPPFSHSTVTFLTSVYADLGPCTYAVFPKKQSIRLRLN